MAEVHFTCYGEIKFEAMSRLEPFGKKEALDVGKSSFDFEDDVGYKNRIAKDSWNDL